MRVKLRTAVCTAMLCLMISSSAFGSDYPLLYTRQVNNNDDIVFVQPANEPQTITDHARKDSSPVLSPDGRFILFTSERVGWWKIWIMDLADRSFHQLTDATAAEFSPCWSPDGNQIAFVSTRDGNAEIYVMNSDGTDLRNISATRSDDATPYWHHDNRIYFSSSVDGTLQIVSVAADGSDRLVHSSGRGDKFMPQISPANDTMLYYAELEGNTDIYRTPLMDYKPERLTADALLDMRARWSPDGQQIVFERGDKRRNQHIYIMDSDGSNVRKISQDGYNYSASFVANCKHLCATDWP